MPTYEYTCRECGEPLEVVQSFTDDALTTCPSCGGELKKVFGNIGIVFKGSGFYKTDSRSGSAASKTSSEAAASTSSDSKSEATKDPSGSDTSDKSKTPDKSDKKPEKKADSTSTTTSSASGSSTPKAAAAAS